MSAALFCRYPSQVKRESERTPLTLPERADGWLLRVAHNQLIDALRRASRVDPLPPEHNGDADVALSGVDDELALIFLCCHPSLRRAAQLALTLALGVTCVFGLAPALRASCAYPGLFVPIQYDGRTLVDGFLTSPVPVEGALLLNADVVVAVFLESGGIENPRTAVDIISRSFNIIQGHSEVSWRQQADVVIEPDVTSFAWDDFTKTPELVAAGEAAAKKAVPEILALLQRQKKDSAD